MIPMMKLQWQRLTTNPIRILMYLIVPVVLFAIGIQLSYPGQANLIYYFHDADQTAVSALYAEDFSVTEDITVASLAEAEEKILDNDAHFSIVIPEGFTNSLLAGTPMDIQVISIESPEINVMPQVRIKNLTENLLALAQATGTTEASDLVALYVESFSQGLQFNSEPVEVNRVEGMQFGSGFILMMLAFNGFGIASLVLQDRQGGTLSRIRTTPANALDQIFSILIVGGGIMLINILSVAVLNTLIFKVQANFFSYLALYLGALIFLILGMYISLTARKTDAVSTLQNLIIVPTSMISGAYWPLELMPEFMQKIAMLTPQYWAVDAVAVMAKDFVLSDVAIHFFVLLAFLVLLTTILAVRLKTMQQTESFA